MTKCDCMLCIHNDREGHCEFNKEFTPSICSVGLCSEFEVQTFDDIRCIIDELHGRYNYF